MKVFLIVATTVDGFIGRDAGHFADWTSREDKKLFVRLTKEAGVMVMGSRTFTTIGRALPGRRTIVYTSKPETIVAEGVEATNEGPAELIARLESEGAPGVAICGGASVYQLFMEAGVVDELYFTIEPLLFGKGVSPFSGQLNTALTLVDIERLNENTVLLHYSIRHD